MRAPLWLHAGHWKAAAEAVATIESWRRIPAPRAWGVGGRLSLGRVPAAGAVGGGGYDARRPPRAPRGAPSAARRWRQIANPDQMAPRCAQMSCTVAGAHCIERSAGCEPSEAHAVSAAASFSPISPGYSLAWLDGLRNSATVCIMARLFRKRCCIAQQ